MQTIRYMMSGFTGPTGAAGRTLHGRNGTLCVFADLCAVGNINQPSECSGSTTAASWLLHPLLFEHAAGDARSGSARGLADIIVRAAMNDE